MCNRDLCHPSSVRGSPPVLTLADGGSGQVNVTCVSEGWYPQPTLTWRNQGGTEIPSQSSRHTTGESIENVLAWQATLMYD